MHGILILVSALAVTIAGMYGDPRPADPAEMADLDQDSADPADEPGDEA
jgi:hypothetical protein